MDEEIFVPCKYNKNYLVGNKGTIKNKRGKVLSPWEHCPGGAKYITFQHQYKRTHYRMDQIIREHHP